MAMQIQVRNRQVAQQLAMVREAFNWWGGFYGIAALGLLAGYVRTKNPAVISPLIPLTFVVGYQADMAMGNKMERILSELERERGGESEQERARAKLIAIN